MMMIRLIALFKKEFIQFFRDKALVLLVIYIFLEVALCGWALFLDVIDLPMVVYDMDKSADSRELIQGFQSTENFKIEYYVNNYENIDELLNSGKAKMALVIPPDFSLKLVRGMQAKIQLLADGSNSQISTTALGYAEQIIRSYSMEVEIKRLGINKDLESLPVITNNISVLYDPSLSYTHYIVLSMVAIAALFIGVLLAAGAVVREKEAGTMEQLMVTPASPTEIIIAKILPMGLVKMVGLGIGVMLAMFVFHVPHSGSLALFFLLSTLIFFTGMGLGFFWRHLPRIYSRHCSYVSLCSSR